MKCAYCGCTDSRACPGGCYWAKPKLCSVCADRLPEVKPGRLWRNNDGQARICGVVPAEGVPYAVMLRTRGAGGRKRTPFLLPVPSLFAGEDGWQFVPEKAHA